MCYKSLCILEHLRDLIANSFYRKRFLRKLLGLKIVVMNLFDKYDVWTNGQTYGRMGQGHRDACASKKFFFISCNDWSQWIHYLCINQCGSRVMDKIVRKIKQN